MKVVINRCYGGFSLSTKGYEWLIKNKGWTVTEYTDEGNYKDDSADLVDSKAYNEKNYPGSRIMNERRYYPVSRTSENEFRTDPDLIEVVETLGKKADGPCASLSVVEIPDDVEWEIGEYDGNEWVQELHRRWS